MASQDDPTGAPIRASDAERDGTIDVLRDASAEGRLTFEELADRIEAATTATTRGELERLTADLPVDAHPIPRGSGAAGGAAVVAPVNESTVFGDVRRSGPWRVPDSSRFSTLFGDIELDLREAVVGQARVEIDAGTVFGDVTLLVPEGVVVEVRTKTFFGDSRQKAGLSGPPGATVVVLTGGTWFGDVRVKSERLRERLLGGLGRARG
ncbi:DUF1707 SHOCT-like domain-containing protein [Patulibacter americanus]|uniref:DUF1707 SHOCT-like domain-containing protein n=1 Tax=Patulibacter americanus TaxID=588672 RepID=UPI0003B54F6D|nr:DUF1707 domain-containing protein [Patulibacter americanus]